MIIRYFIFERNINLYDFKDFRQRFIIYKFSGKYFLIGCFVPDFNITIELFFQNPADILKRLFSEKYFSVYPTDCKIRVGKILNGYLGGFLVEDERLSGIQRVDLTVFLVFKLN